MEPPQAENISRCPNLPPLLRFAKQGGGGKLVPTDSFCIRKAKQNGGDSLKKHSLKKHLTNIGLCDKKVTN
jgi:hypothetical protein